MHSKPGINSTSLNMMKIISTLQFNKIVLRLLSFFVDFITVSSVLLRLIYFSTGRKIQSANASTQLILVY